jgi:hypothetical protein
MSDNTEHRTPNATPRDTSGEAGPEVKDEPESRNPAVGPSNSEPGPGGDPTAALKRGLAANRLPADVKEQILAELPSPEEQERLYREVQENGGLSSEEFFASLGLEVKPQP